MRQPKHISGCIESMMLGMGMLEYESPIELMLASKLIPILSKGVKLTPQYWVTTPEGKYRLDFMIKINGRKIGIECDGKLYHNFNRDVIRDGNILRAGEIEKIWRFRGTDIYNNLTAIFCRMALKEPGLIEEKAYEKLRRGFVWPVMKKVVFITRRAPNPEKKVDEIPF